ncbi:sigma-E factor negative regulatory protein [Comamonas composti]|uniref:sigma-E factor negative regulatory protein n=1 Tax=Comamonas composti TaxID=408558 RepID=UPI0004132F45|nr:sigma-E factor negative regulatory protein [Comamonas composti]
MNDELIKRELSREQLSALADGELSEAELQAVLGYAESEQGQQEWRLYHLVGDVLRSPELAHHCQSDVLGGVRAALAKEARRPGAAQLAAAPELEQVAWPERLHAVVNGAAVHDAANASVFRWKMTAGFASVAAVAAIGWSVMLSSPSPQQTSVVATLDASAGQPAQPQAQAPAQARASAELPLSSIAQSSSVVAVASPYGQSVMLRDPRLDELLAAQPEFNGPATLQMPASFLRNANFAASRASRP